MKRSFTLLAAFLSLAGFGVWSGAGAGAAIAQLPSPAAELPSLDSTESVLTEGGSSSDLITEPVDASSMPLVPVRDPAAVEPVNPSLTRIPYVGREPLDNETPGETGPAQVNRVQFLLE